MKTYKIKLDENWIELTKRPEIYLFTDETCTHSEWFPFDMNKLQECQKWVLQKMYKDHDFNLHSHEDIRFILKNSEDIELFKKWMNTFYSINLKQHYVKNIRYYQLENNVIVDNITFLNSALVQISDNEIEISADFITQGDKV